ncbi:unnamed protein product [Calicophoron daubneyi]|uniref:Zinc transporter n=1 Tax=Calicophoron daubneyi TaxID=300641 RepID=A0AAV2TRA1_CALDB
MSNEQSAECQRPSFGTQSLMEFENAQVHETRAIVLADASSSNAALSLNRRCFDGLSLSLASFNLLGASVNRIGDLRTRCAFFQCTLPQPCCAWCLLALVDVTPESGWPLQPICAVVLSHYSFRMLRLSLLLLLVCASSILSDEHEHHHHEHEHVHEAPHYKYSAEANIKDGGSVHVHKHTHEHVTGKIRVDSPLHMWLETMGAVGLISVAPFLMLALLPDLSKHQGMLKILLGFAAGGLLGDAFLHLIPHAIDRGHGHHDDHSNNIHEHDHRHHLVVGLSVVGGIFIFLCIEKLIRLARHNRGGSCSHGPQPVNSVQSNDVGQQKNRKSKGVNNADNNVSKKEKRQSKAASGTELKVAGYLNLAADFTHNFTDGMAIGASFLMGRSLGFVTTLTVLFHELPHEIGDYAILIQSGFSARKAMFLQLVTAVGAMFGAALSLMAAGVGVEAVIGKLDLPVLTEDIVTSVVLPFTAGGFIYIAMTSVLPDLLGNDHEGTKRSHDSLLKRTSQSIAEIVALVAGIGMMVFIGSME